MAENSKNKITPNQNSLLSQMVMNMMSRAMLAQGGNSGIGLTHNGTRDLYTLLGYKKELSFQDYYWRYQRQDIATRVVTAFPSAAWSLKPRIHETKAPKDETPFEKEWHDLVIKKKVFHYLSNADKISGIGRFGIILLGIADGKPLSAPATPRDKQKLIYIRPYHEGNVTVSAYNKDIRSERFGLPERYQIKTRIDEVIEEVGAQSGASDISSAREVHWTRVIHVLPELDSENDIYASPRLKNVYNRLQDVETVSGGSAEMFFQGAFRGMAFKADEGAEMNSSDRAALSDEIEKYINHFQRHLKLQNIDVKELGGQVADPKNCFDVYMTLISAAKGIPKRILLGSERGELASNQDESNWIKRVDERRVEHTESLILRPFIDRLIYLKIISKPQNEYLIEWPDLYATSGIDKAKISESKMRALKDYLTMQGDQVIPIEVFLEKEMGYSQSNVDRCMEAFKGALRDENNNINNPNNLNQ